MIISYHTVGDNIDITLGYGNAGFNLVTTFQALGHKVPFDDPTAPIQISFCSPYAYKFYPNQYKIGFTPWESTELPAGWLERMNECDEIWATSEWTANVYKNAGVTPPIYVFDHGVDQQWTPVVRHAGDVVRFLHVGEPALRKGGQMAVDAFRAAFGDSSDVHLTMKAYTQHWLRAYTPDGKILTPADAYNNVSIMVNSVSAPKMRELYHEHDVLVYPSYGEGFGLIPLQALASGMPVICSNGWAPYKDFLGPLSLDGRWDRSVWSVHPGNVFYPDYDQLVDLLRYSKENIPSLHKYFYQQAPDVLQRFDWKINAEKVLKHLTEK